MATKEYKPTAVNQCPHKERPHYAKGMCHSCYVATRNKSKKQIRVNKPEVAEHVAKAILKNNMDVEQAVAQDIAPEVADKPGEVGRIADELRESLAVQKAIERALEAKGLDDTSKNMFVAKIWEWFLSGTEKERIAAARLLGRGFIGEKIDDKKPLELKIEGFAEGMAKMLGKAESVAGAPAPATEEEMAAEAAEEGEDDFDDEESRG